MQWKRESRKQDKSVYYVVAPHVASHIGQLALEKLLEFPLTYRKDKLGVLLLILLNIIIIVYNSIIKLSLVVKNTVRN